MDTQLEGCFPVKLNIDDEITEVVLYKFDEGYQTIETNHGEADVFNDFAAAQASSETNTPLADYLNALYQESDANLNLSMEEQDNSSKPNTTINLNGEEWGIQPNQGIILASAWPNGNIEADEDVLMEDLGDYEDFRDQLPSHENWYQPDIAEMEITEQDIDKEDFEQRLEFEKYVSVQCNSPQCEIPHPVMKFENGSDDVKMPVQGYENSMVSEQFKRDMKTDIENGEYDGFKPAATVAAYPSEDANLEDVDFLDMDTLPALLLQESDQDLEAYMICRGDQKDTYISIGDQAVELNNSSFAALYPAVKDSVQMGGADVKNENLGVDGSEPASDPGRY